MKQVSTPIEYIYGGVSKLLDFACASVFLCYMADKNVSSEKDSTAQITAVGSETRLTGFSCLQVMQSALMISKVTRVTLPKQLLDDPVYDAM